MAPPRKEGASRRAPLALLVALLSATALYFAPALFLYASEIELHSCNLTEPNVYHLIATCDASLTLPLALPLDIRTTQAHIKILSANLTQIGTLNASEIIINAGNAKANFLLVGTAAVENSTALKFFSLDMLQLDELYLHALSVLHVHVGPFSMNLELNKQTRIRGAAGLPHRVVSFEVLEANPDHAAGSARFPGFSSPNQVVLDIEVDNPSTFALLPIGSLQISVETAEGQRLAFVRTNSTGPLNLHRGRSYLRLIGKFSENANSKSMGRLLGKHLSGDAVPLSASILSVATPVYDFAFRNARINSNLPGERQPLIPRVFVVLNSAILAEWASPFGSHEFLLDTFMQVRNPFGASVSVMHIAADISWRDEQIASMQVSLDPSDRDYDPVAMYEPLTVPPLTLYSTPRAYPCKIVGAFETVREIVSIMQSSWELNVSVSVNLTVGTGSMVVPLTYEQEQVVVYVWHAPPSPPLPPSSPFIRLEDLGEVVSNFNFAHEFELPEFAGS